MALTPNDPVVHELLALSLFATGDYAPAAAVLNNLLAVAPGMDWTTLSGLYSSVNVYEQQLDALDRFCQSHPQDGAPHFVLAYHRLICGDTDAAIAALKVVVQEQPKDEVAQRMLQALDTTQELAATPPPPAAGEKQPEAVADATESAPTTDLIGQWQAKRDAASFNLQLDEDGNFVWNSTAAGQEPVKLSGTYTVANDMLILESGEQGTMVGKTKAIDADRFSFRPVESSPTDQGLSFGRLKR